jgi:hypothetical protein
MSMPLVDRRQFLTLPLVFLLAPVRQVCAAPGTLRARYSADIGILYDLLNLQLEGSIEQSIDRVAGDYQVRMVGSGLGVAHRMDCAGMLHAGRWKPAWSQSRFDIKGRESHAEITYHWDRRQIEYHARGETFFLRRLRVVDDVVPLSDGTHVDDLMSATLNYVDNRWLAHDDNVHRTLVVRRRRVKDEGPDDIAPSYGAEVVPLELKIVRDRSGEPAGLLDLSIFSPWAKPSQPARILFGPDRRPKLITSSMMFGTSVTVRINAI